MVYRSQRCLQRKACKSEVRNLVRQKAYYYEYAAVEEKLMSWQAVAFRFSDFGISSRTGSLLPLLVPRDDFSGLRCSNQVYSAIVE